MNRLMWGMAAAGLCVSAGSALAADKVTPDQIKATFATGVPFTSTAPSGKVVTITFKTDGTGTLQEKGKRASQGKWRVSSNGYCSAWDKSAEHCYTLVKDGDKYSVLGATGSVVARWTPPKAAPAATPAPAPAKR
jgi:hypothetical protein